LVDGFVRSARRLSDVSRITLPRPPTKISRGFRDTELNHWGLSRDVLARDLAVGHEDKTKP
jgi:hypothetical protein